MRRSLSRNSYWSAGAPLERQMRHVEIILSGPAYPFLNKLHKITLQFFFSRSQKIVKSASTPRVQSSTQKMWSSLLRLHLGLLSSIFSVINSDCVALLRREHPLQAGLLPYYVWNIHHKLVCCLIAYGTSITSWFVDSQAGLLTGRDLVL